MDHPSLDYLSSTHVLALTSQYEEKGLTKALKDILSCLLSDSRLEVSLRSDLSFLPNCEDLSIQIRNNKHDNSIRVMIGKTPLVMIKTIGDHAQLEQRGLLNLMTVYFYMLNHIKLSRVDALTGVLNRQAFNNDMQALSKKEQVKHRRKTEFNKTLALLDIDNFKSVNDRFGHMIGDEVLVMFGQLMQTTFREMDLCYRYGGEEFAVVVSQPEDNNSFSILERFRNSVANHRFPQVGQVTVSIGYTIMEPGFSRTELLDQVDKALYYSKNNGRNQINAYESLSDANKQDRKSVV